MATVWERVELLEGQTLRTKTGKAFRVVSVDRQYVTVEPEKTRVARSIRRTDFEAAYDLHIPVAKLTSTQLVKETGTSFNPVYIVSMLKAIVGDTNAQPRPKPKGESRPEQGSAEGSTTQLGRMEEFTAQLERIVRLHKEGTLSDSEFEQAKRKILKITE